MARSMLSAVLEAPMAQTIDPQSFYAHLHAVARERGMKATTVIKKAGFTPQAGEKWKGATAPRYETRVRLAKACRSSTQASVGGAGNRQIAKWETTTPRACGASSGRGARRQGTRAIPPIRRRQSRR